MRSRTVIATLAAIALALGVILVWQTNSNDSPDTVSVLTPTQPPLPQPPAPTVSESSAALGLCLEPGCELTATPTAKPNSTSTATPNATSTAPPTSTPSATRLSWTPPTSARPQRITVDQPGTVELRDDTDYVISAPTRINGPVVLRGGRNVTWVGGRIYIPAPASGPIAATARRGLVIVDNAATRGRPGAYGNGQTWRQVHIEGLLIDGPGLSEGINTNSPAAVVTLQNIRVQGVHFRNSDDRDGVLGWQGNHPDVLQTWGSQRELRVDGLSATSAYQGIFLKEDAVDSVRGPVWLRRVDVQAIERKGTDGVAYAGHRMLSWYGDRVGKIRVDPGTVRVTAHPRSGWNRARQNPAPGTAFWRGRYYNPALSRHVLEPPPGGAVFTDALGDTMPSAVGRDAFGQYAQWTSTVRNWTDTAPGRIYSGRPTTGNYVPGGTAGLTYRSPGYR